MNEKTLSHWVGGMLRQKTKKKTLNAKTKGILYVNKCTYSNQDASKFHNLFLVSSFEVQIEGDLSGLHTFRDCTPSSELVHVLLL